jgi:hypothetical protein
MKTFIKNPLLLLTAVTALSGARAADYSMMITTAEGSGAFNTTLGNTSVYTFDNLPTGANSGLTWNNVGTIDKVGVLNANQYGGAPKADGTGATRYAVESTSSALGGVAKSTLTLDKSSSYFGLYWSAGDSANVLDFYNGKDLVAHFTTANLMNKLSSGYNGNPNSSFKGLDSPEKFGFINFMGNGGTTWDSIVFSNTGTSGFESDNWTSRVNGWNPTVDTLPGTPVELIQNTGGVQTMNNITGVTVKGSSVTIAAVDSNGKALTAAFVPAAPGAPAPSVTACLAFAGVLLLQAIRRSKSVI